MYNPASVLSAYTLAEIPFILMASSIFNLLFYFVMGFTIDPAKFFVWFSFVTLAMTSKYAGNRIESIAPLRHNVRLDGHAPDAIFSFQLLRSMGKCWCLCFVIR